MRSSCWGVRASLCEKNPALGSANLIWADRRGTFFASIAFRRAARGTSISTRKHIHEEVFATSQTKLFALLHTPSAIRAWWGAARAIVIAQPGGIWAATWGSDEDDPDYNSAATIRDFAPPRRMVLADYHYVSKTGPLPFRISDFVTEFLVEPHAEGALLRVTQDGFPAGEESDDFYAACQRGWHETFAGIRRFLAEQAESR